MLARSHRAAALLGGGAAALVTVGCASARLPSPEVLTRARHAQTYSASLRFSLAGDDLRGRGRAIVAFERPDRLRIEVPGPTGARVVMVVREGALVAVFPGERAVFQATASEASLRDLFGLALAPSEIMDVLVGAPPSRLRSCRVRWGPTLPRSVDAELADGTRLSLRVDSAEPDVAIPPAAFSPPPSDGFRAIDAAEARTLWSR